jgi:quercetin dioxygenase-like cupin family protein
MLLAVFGAAASSTTRGSEVADDPVANPPESVDPAVYSKIDDPGDPYAAVYEEFRARRVRDQVDPDLPPPAPRYEAVHLTRKQPWGKLDDVLPIGWEAVRAEAPKRASALESAFAARLALDHPDVKIVQMMLGPGGVLPAHAGGSPGVWIVVGGRGEISVEGETRTATPGTTAKLAAYDVRRLHAQGDAPLCVLWIRWAPGGDQAYIDAGYYLTGANMHLQPAQSTLPEDYLFWDAIYRSVVVADPVSTAAAPAPGSAAEAAVAELARRRKALGPERDLYPDVRRWGHESDIPWLSAETLKSGGFFFSKDIGRMQGIVDRAVQISRHKAIFRAVRPDGRWDYNISQTTWGPRSTYVEHSHLVPEFYYVLSGPVLYGVDGDLHEVLPGDIIVNNSYSPHLARGIVDGLPFDNFGSTWAPNGDRRVFERPFFLVEPLPAQPPSATLPENASFH